MCVEIIEESAAALPDYEKVSIAFWVKSVFCITPINSGLGGLRFVEESVAPYVKDYDEYESERPTRWPQRWDISHWGILSAFKGLQRVGGAAVAWRTFELQMLEGANDLACLWDLRVHPDYRRQGIGRLLFERSVAWSRQRGCRWLKVETQNINVPACRFYASHGCELGAINRYAYPSKLSEVQLLWYLQLD